MIDGTFDQDLAAIRRSLDESRRELIAVIEALSDAGLDAERRGGWSVRRVLEHVIQSEHIYARLIQNLRGLTPSQDPLPSAPNTAAGAKQQEESARRALTESLDGVNEETFYRMGKIGHEEYSVLSVLENQANHEREHAEQIKSILAAR